MIEKTNKTGKMGMKLMILFMLIVYGSGYGQLKWEKAIGGNNYENPSDILKIKNGYLLGAVSYSNIGSYKSENCRGAMDYWVIKVDNSGNKIWDKTFGSNVSDELSKIYQTSDGGFLLCGESRGTNNFDKTDTLFGERDIWIVKIDSNGTKIWDKSFGGIGTEYFGGFTESSNAYYFVSKTGSDSTGNKTSKAKGYSDIWLIKTDKQGNKILDKTYGGSNNDDVFGGIIKNNENSFFICGSSASNASGDKSNNIYGTSTNTMDYWVIKIDSNGNKIWDKIYGSTGNEQMTASCHNKNSIILSGLTSGGISDVNNNMTGTRISKWGFDLWVISIDTNGNKIWDKLIVSDSTTHSKKISTAENGSVIISSYSSSNSGYDKTESKRGGEDIWIIKLDSNGKKIWDKTLGTIKDDSWVSAIRSDSNSTVIASYSPTNGPSFDKTISSNLNNEIWLFELKDPLNKITGKIYPDFNSNCNLDSPKEYNITNKIIYNTIENTFAISNGNNYVLYNYGSDSAILKVINIEAPSYVACSKDSIKVKFNGLIFKDTSNINFPIRSTKSGYCPTITSHSNSLLRPGRWSKYTICYQNNAMDTTFNAYIEVVLDLGDIDSISSSHSYTITGNKIKFQLGYLKPFEYNCITYNIKLKSNKKIGSKHCHKSRIYPDCNIKDIDPKEDSSDILCSIQCLSNDTVELTLSNIGSKNQSDWGLIKSYEDVIIFKMDSFKLNVGNSKIFKYKVDTNKVYTAEILNNNFNSIHPKLIVHDDLCSNKKPIIFDNPVLNFSRHDEAREYEEDCDIVRGSYDPNIKSVIPVGLFSQHYTATGTELKYRIDFQNTGTDTAFRVVLIDTLSKDLNISTFIPGVSSHPYSIEFGGRAVKFIFDPIKLVDSFHNEAESHGFVTFKIKHNSNITPKTKIENKADIYFDYNTAVRTNSVFNTIFDTIQIYVPKADVSIQGQNELTTSIYPNPASEHVVISMNEAVKNLLIELIDLNGRTVQRQISRNEKSVEVQVSQLQKGIYILRCLSDEKLIVMKKLEIK